MIVLKHDGLAPGIPARSRSKGNRGLSGRPLFDLSTRMLAQTFLRLKPVPARRRRRHRQRETAFAKIEAGATLLQIYSALVFEGIAWLADKRGPGRTPAQKGSTAFRL